MTKAPGYSVTTQAIALLLALLCFGSAAETQRVQHGLVAFYDFQEGIGAVVRDRSPIGKPADLRIEDTEKVRWTPGGLEIHGETIIRSEEPPIKVIELVRRGGEFTIEAWLRPATPEQKGPARIVTLSGGSSARNFTLGQDGSRYDIRFRTSETSGNGIPSQSSPPDSLSLDLDHVVYTRDRNGKTHIYLNGEAMESGTVAGDTRTWDAGFHLALGNEMSNDRGWRGTYHLVAIYDRALASGEVSRNHQAGPDVATPAGMRRDDHSPGASHFATRVAPILAKHCLECHDSRAREGDLDLSRRESALGAEGVIVPGKSAESLLWQEVEADFMPDERPPLSAEEKEALRQWLDEGAAWNLDQIDPAVYVHSGGADQNWLRRLTIPEYINSVKSTTGVDIADAARETLPQDLRADGFSNTAYNLGVDLAHVDAYGKLASKVVDAMDLPAFISRQLDAKPLDPDSMETFISRAGAKLLRGPLSDDEIRAYRGIVETVTETGGNHEEAARYIVEAMLQAPRFLYRMEQQRGDGYPWPAGGHEIASRISYILWGAPPDDALMAAAEEGALHDATARGAQVDRMLADPRARERALRFAYEWLNLGYLDNLQPSPERFPDWDPALAGDMREETLTFFEEVAWVQDRPLADLFNAQVTYATPRLAKHYGLAPQGDGLARYDLAGQPARGGLLTQGSLLAVGGDGASTVTRGLFVLHHILRGTVNDPPPGLDTTPVPPSPGQSRRAIAESRVNSGSCGGCHSRFEPLSYALERYDGLGAYVETDEHGNALRQDGEILFPGDAETVAYDSTAAMMDRLAASDRVQQTITWKLTQFALGRPLAAADAPIVEQIHETAREGGGTYRVLIRAIVSSDLVLMTRTEEIQ